MVRATRGARTAYVTTSAASGKKAISQNIRCKKWFDWLARSQHHAMGNFFDCSTRFVACRDQNFYLYQKVGVSNRAYISGIPAPPTTLPPPIFTTTPAPPPTPAPTCAPPYVIDFLSNGVRFGSSAESFLELSVLNMDFSSRSECASPCTCGNHQSQPSFHL